MNTLRNLWSEWGSSENVTWACDLRAGVTVNRRTRHIKQGCANCYSEMEVFKRGTKSKNPTAFSHTKKCHNAGKFIPALDYCKCSLNFEGKCCERKICTHGYHMTHEDRCNCYEGYNGEFCQHMIVPPCQNNGTRKKYNRCDCSGTRFIGPYCESKWCLHGGTVVQNGTRCLCQGYVDGEFCENIHCLNGGTVVQSQPKNNIQMQYNRTACQCRRLYKGVNCEQLNYGTIAGASLVIILLISVLILGLYAYRRLGYVNKLAVNRSRRLRVGEVSQRSGPRGNRLNNGIPSPEELGFDFESLSPGGARFIPARLHNSPELHEAYIQWTISTEMTPPESDGNEIENPPSYNEVNQETIAENEDVDLPTYDEAVTRIKQTQQNVRRLTEVQDS